MTRSLGPFQRLRRRMEWSRQARGLLLREHLSKVARTVPFTSRVRLWGGGFLSESQVLYELNRNSPDEYVSDRFRWLASPFINGSPYLLDDKYVFAHVLAGLGFPTPRVLATYAGDGRVMTPEQVHTATSPELLPWLQSLGMVVFKPRFGGGGKRVAFVRAQSGELTVNGSSTKPVDFFARLGTHDYIVCQFAEQHAYAKRIFPDATNTLRVLTMREPETARPFIARAIHRFGTTSSAPVDNFSKGGLSVALEVETGQLGAGVTFPHDGRLTFVDVHPDTQQQLRGWPVPGWPQVREGLLALAARFPADVPYVGWDVVVTDDGFTVLEGNRYSDVNLLQVHGPLLRDSRVRAFYEHHASRVGLGWPSWRRS